MPKIPKTVIKELVKDRGLRLNEKAADAITKILEKKAKEIAEYAVKNAKKNNREKITKEDIEAYIMKYGD
ncbi:NFYB/HAP3 family transcription factor subunit [Candidatus Marsarchaeota archaeon]|jgi:histone H3/H4|nr:NFYB/HAP3 family transcription factor subunit [Candidatus Marsarchaeota archaeon]MCL5090001.1 NFYB/HAP3 family transcription factor subunit [Candidatus Marsarchaeota archaeon]